MVDVCETTTMWLDDRREPRSTLGWEWTICKHYLGKSSRALKQIQKASDHQSYRSTKLRARMRLVVATRLQVQHPSFRLRTSSNTPFVLMNDAHGSFANSDEDTRFPSCNFCLKKHLNEPT
jgi:hypothetical protein